MYSSVNSPLTPPPMHIRVEYRTLGLLPDKRAKSAYHRPIASRFTSSRSLFASSSTVLSFASAAARVRASSSAATSQIGLSDLLYSFNLVTKLSKSC